MLENCKDTGQINIDCVDPLGRSALLMAIDNENLEMVELLLENKVNETQINNTADRTLDVVFSRFKGFSFTITQRSYGQAVLNYTTEREQPRNSFELLTQSYCERKPLNLEKTTSSVLSVILLIYVM